MNVTNIEWTTFSSNPLKYRDAAGKSVWACVHASPGCQHCYAETLAQRYGRGGPFNVPTTNKVTPYLDEKELRQMLTATSIKGVPVSGSRVFVGDMTDAFGEWVPDELLDQLFAVMALRPDVTWQLLTKRAKRMRDYIKSRDFDSIEALYASPIAGYIQSASRALGHPIWMNAPLEFVASKQTMGWPPKNVWLGVSAEDQQRADERIPLLLQTPAAVRFVSAEPLIASIWFHEFDHRPCIDWVIVGGESGPGARECKAEWVRSLISQCRAADVAVFVKQLGSRPTPQRIGYLSGKYLFGGQVEAPYSLELLSLADRKGGDISEWPADLRVRQFPAAESAEWRERRSAR